MGLFQRISDILKSNINDLISKAEDPERLLNTAIEDMKKQVKEAKARVASSIADQSRLVAQRDKEQKKASDWEEKAMVAVRAGRDDLAMEALARKREHEQATSLFDEQLDTQRMAVDELKRALGELTSKLEETQRRRNLLIARAKRAEAQRHLALTLSASTENSAAERLERLEAKIERQEAEAEATWEIAAVSGSALDRDLSTEIERLDVPSADDELTALKKKLHALDTGEKPQKALGAGSSDRSDANLTAQIAEVAADPNSASPQSTPPDLPEDSKKSS